MVKPPAPSTIHVVLDRHGLVKRRKRRRHKVQGTQLSDALAPNALWWLRLGISIERIKPGHLQQNGRHERMHLTLKKEATKPPSYNFLQQQERFDEFVEVYNNERPHQSLEGLYPGELYTPSPREFFQPEVPEYPRHDRTVKVTRCGRICIGEA
jgi:putative transposase